MSHPQASEEENNMIPYKSLHEECGVFGIMDKDSAGLGQTLFFGLYALQHRGQESCGMAVYDNHQLRIHKEMGLVNQVFNEHLLDSLTGQIGIGHTRYSTTGGSNLGNAQPVVIRTPFGALTLAHNGNLINTESLRSFLAEKGYFGHGTSDSHLIALYINYLLNQGKALKDAVKEALEACEGAFSVVIATGDTLIAARDRNGLRPFCMGRTKHGALVMASETAALDIVGAEFERDIAPGEIVFATFDDYYAGLQLDGTGRIESLFLEGPKKEHLCVFELVYFARPDSRINERSVYTYRLSLGRRLAEISPAVQADIVIPVPDSGNVAAVGYSQASGIPYAEGLIKNRYVGRTFISPTHELREKGIQLKLNPLRDVLQGKSVIVVDDSIVRGNTSRNLVKMLKEAGVREVHMRISSAKVTNPCYYGIDMSNKDQLIANKLPNTEAIREYLGVDSLVYLSVDDMLELAGSEIYCAACFSGHYPAGTPADFDAEPTATDAKR
jgi:amidophosphoribosyltransferase